MPGEESAELPDRLGELLERVESKVVHTVDRLISQPIMISSWGILLPRPAEEDRCKFYQILPVRVNELSHKILLVLRPENGLLHLAEHIRSTLYLPTALTLLQQLMHKHQHLHRHIHGLMISYGDVLDDFGQYLLQRWICLG